MSYIMSQDILNDFTKEIVTPTVRLRLLTCGIVHYTYLPNSEINIEEHQLNHNALVEITEGKKAHLLIDSDEFINITSEARKRIRELETVVPIKTRALIITCLSPRILANFYIKFYKPLVPTKIFNNANDGIHWLLSLK